MEYLNLVLSSSAFRRLRSLLKGKITVKHNIWTSFQSSMKYCGKGSAVNTEICMLSYRVWYKNEGLDFVFPAVFDWSLQIISHELVGAYARRRRRRRRRRRSLATWRPIYSNLYVDGNIQCTSLTLKIRDTVNWHLSKQDIRWPVSRDHIAGLSLELIDITCFLKMTADQILVLIESRAQAKLTYCNQGRLFGIQLTLTQD